MEVKKIDELEDNEKRWSFKKAIVNSLRWENTDWEYVKTHIVWFLIILLLASLYYAETQQAREFVGSECVKKCLVEKYIEDFKAQNPSIQINCQEDRCEFYGLLQNEKEKEFIKKLNEFNLSINYSNGS